MAGDAQVACGEGLTACECRKSLWPLPGRGDWKLRCEIPDNRYNRRAPRSHDSLMLQDDIDENEETMREAGSFHVLATL